VCNGTEVKSVRIEQLDPATLAALAAGTLPTGGPVPLTEHLVGPDHRALWRRRSFQVAIDPGAATWVTGVVWAPDLAVSVGRAGFHGPPDATGMVEVGYAIDPTYRRRGYARAAQEPAVRTVRASVRPDNVASGDLVESFGFVPVGEQWDDEDGLESVYERPA
jgi:RimJ/RimL family protein N-acetyltransferase